MTATRKRGRPAVELPREIPEFWIHPPVFHRRVGAAREFEWSTGVSLGNPEAAFEPVETVVKFWHGWPADSPSPPARLPDEVIREEVPGVRRWRWPWPGCDPAVAELTSRDDFTRWLLLATARPWHEYEPARKALEALRDGIEAMKAPLRGVRPCDVLLNLEAAKALEVLRDAIPEAFARLRRDGPGRKREPYKAAVLALRDLVEDGLRPRMKRVPLPQEVALCLVAAGLPLPRGGLRALRDMIRKR